MRSVWVHSTAKRSLSANALGPNRKLITCSFLFERKNNGEALWIQRKKVRYKFNKLITWTSRIQQRKCNHVEAIFASISWQLGIIKRLVRRLNQPMTARLIKTARSLKIPQKNYWTDCLHCSASASPLLWRDDFIGQTLSHDLSREKLSRRGQRTLTRGKWNSLFAF